jgi:translation initiation factor 1A
MEERSEEVERIRTPKEDEVIGKVIDMLGGDRMRVRCADGLERICRVPGKFKKRMWTKIGDIIILRPWSLQGDKKADLVWRYSKSQVDTLRRLGKLQEIEH